MNYIHLIKLFTLKEYVDCFPNTFYVEANMLDKINPNNIETLIENYNLSKDSYFLDIGSSFGKPVFHCAYQVGCICQGIEVVPARVEFCIDFYFGFSDGRNDLPEKIKVKINKRLNAVNLL